MQKNLKLRKSICIGILFAFLGQGLILPPAHAQDFYLPAPGVMVSLSPEFNPPILKGIKVHPDNPFRFEFILDKGDSELSNNQLKDESSKLIKYFLASLTIPENDLWVNLSPYEKDRIIPNSFGLTEMGRDLLAEDYMLKQITASLIYPEGEIGKRFWQKIYSEAAKKYGTTNIPVNTFNKVWIVPEKAIVYENAKAGTAYVVESKLKVMLEQDYLSLAKHEGIQSIANVTPAKPGIHNKNDINLLGSQMVREIVIPELTKEVNVDKNFFHLRQVYNSLILAYWYKKKIKYSILAQIYSAKNKVAGINIDDPQEKERIYQRYLKSFKKGVYNYIKEEQDSLTQEVIPRKYFSGGTALSDRAMSVAYIESPQPPVEQPGLDIINIDLKIAQLRKLAVQNQQKDAAMANTTRREMLIGGVLGTAAAAILLTPYAYFNRHSYQPTQSDYEKAKEGIIVPRDSNEFKQIQDLIQSAMEDQVIKSNPNYLNAVKAFQQASMNELDREEGRTVARSIPVYDGQAYKHAFVGINFDFANKLLKANNPMYKRFLFAAIIKEGATVLEFERRPQFQFKIMTLAHKVGQLTDEELKHYLAMRVDQEAVGYRVEAEYMAASFGGDKDNVDVQTLIELSHQEKDTYLLLTILNKVYLLYAKELNDLYLRAFVYGSTVAPGLEIKIWNRLDNKIFGNEAAALRFYKFEYFEDPTLLRGLQFLNDPAYYGDNAQLSKQLDDQAMIDKAEPIISMEDIFTDSQMGHFIVREDGKYKEEAETNALREAERIIRGIIDRQLEQRKMLVTRDAIEKLVESAMEELESNVVVHTQKRYDQKGHEKYRSEIYLFPQTFNLRIPSGETHTITIPISQLEHELSENPQASLHVKWGRTSSLNIGIIQDGGVTISNFILNGVKQSDMTIKMKQYLIIQSYKRMVSITDRFNDRGSNFDIRKIEPTRNAIIISFLNTRAVDTIIKLDAAMESDTAEYTEVKVPGRGGYREFYDNEGNLHHVLIPTLSGNIRLIRWGSRYGYYDFKAYLNDKMISDRGDSLIFKIIKGKNDEKIVIVQYLFLLKQGLGYGRAILNWIASFAYRQGARVYQNEGTSNPDMLWLHEQELKKESVKMKFKISKNNDPRYGEIVDISGNLLGKVESITVLDLDEEEFDPYSVKGRLGTLFFDSSGTLQSFRLIKHPKVKFVIHGDHLKGIYDVVRSNGRRFHIEVIDGFKIRFFDDKMNKYSTRFSRGYVMVTGELKDPDSAMVSHLGTPSNRANSKLGGIDLTPANMHLQTQNAGEAIKFHIDSAMLQQLQNAPGLVPVIINIEPMRNLRAFLGLPSEAIAATAI